MIYIDSNVFMYAVGRPHPLKADAQNFFMQASEKGKRLVTSAEVLQELLHVYLPVGRIVTLDAALMLATKGVDQVFAIDGDVVLHGRNLASKYPELTARDLLHLSICHKHGIKDLKTFDRILHIAFNKGLHYP